MQSSSNVPEEWRPVVGHEGQYEVSSHGRVKSLERMVPSSFGRDRKVPSKILKCSPDDFGRPRAVLTGQVGHKVHHLVMEAFVGPLPEGMEVCHNDGDPANNRVENLRFDTRSENALDAVGHRSHFNASKTHCPRGHILEEPNLSRSYLKKGERQCLACIRTHDYLRKRSSLKPKFKEISDSYFESIVTGTRPVHLTR